MPGTFFPPPWVSDPDMHHDTCFMLRTEPWCISTPLPNSSLYLPLTHTRLQALWYMPSRHAQPIRLHPGTPRSIIGPFLAHYPRLAQSQWRRNRTIAGKQWGWLYQALRQTASHQWSPPGGRRNLTPIPAASWLDLWALNHGILHGQGIRPCPYRYSGCSSLSSLLR